jgi:NAD(P)H-hydrate epimerase
LSPTSGPIRYLSRDQVREVDRRAVDEYGMSGLVLMENAGRGCAQVLCSLGCQAKVVILCGRGNNAGDGFVIARHLEVMGADVVVGLLSDPKQLSGDAATNFDIIRRAHLPIVELWNYDEAHLLRTLAGSEWIVDALLGTGAVGPPRPPWDEVIEAINEHPARRLAVDLPSGLDCDTGLPSPATVRADCTCTFVAPKLGFMHAASRRYLGEVEVIDIGVPKQLLDAYRQP